MSKLRATSVVMFTAFALALALGGPAWAASDSVTVEAPASAAVGQTVDVHVTVESGGEPVEGGAVSLSYSTVLIGVSGKVVLDSAVTGADGTAVLSYQQRSEVNDKMLVTYLDPEGAALATADVAIGVEPGGVQLTTSASGVPIRRLNASAVVGLIVIVWSLIIFSAFQLRSIGRNAGNRETAARRTATEAGSTWIGTVAAVTTIVVAVGLVTVLVRNPHTHANLGDHAGFSRTPIAPLDGTYAFEGQGLGDPADAETGDAVADGRLLFFGFGCAACHGLSGEGGIVGPGLAGHVHSADGLLDDVRRGPGGMPAFPPEDLTDAQVEKIFEFLEAQPGS